MNRQPGHRPVPQNYKQKYKDAVRGTGQDAKRAAIDAITATNKQQFIIEATPYVKEGNNCPDGWFMCAGGYCAPSKGDCTQEFGGKG